MLKLALDQSILKKAKTHHISHEMLLKADKELMDMSYQKTMDLIAAFEQLYQNDNIIYRDDFSVESKFTAAAGAYITRGAGHALKKVATVAGKAAMRAAAIAAKMVVKILSQAVRYHVDLARFLYRLIVGVFGDEYVKPIIVSIIHPDKLTEYMRNYNELVMQNGFANMVHSDMQKLNQLHASLINMSRALGQLQRTSYAIDAPEIFRRCKSAYEDALKFLNKLNEELKQVRYGAAQVTGTRGLAGTNDVNTSNEIKAKNQKIIDIAKTFMGTSHALIETITKDLKTIHAANRLNDSRIMQQDQQQKQQAAAANTKALNQFDQQITDAVTNWINMVINNINSNQPNTISLSSHMQSSGVPFTETGDCFKAATNAAVSILQSKNIQFTPSTLCTNVSTLGTEIINILTANKNNLTQPTANQPNNNQPTPPASLNTIIAKYVTNIIMQAKQAIWRNKVQNGGTP